MRVWRDVREPLFAGVLWSALALACVALRDGLGAALLIWLPSGVAVAAFHSVPVNRWPLLAAVMYPIQAVTVWWISGSVQQAVVYSFATLLQSVIAAQLGYMALGGRHEIPRRFGQVAGLFAAALLGSLAGAVVAIPFRPVQSLDEFMWWFFANVLAIQTLVPIMLVIRMNLGKRGLVQFLAFARKIRPFMLGTAIFTIVALQVSEIVLMPLMFALIVLATVRYGQIASLLVVLMYVAIATIISILQETPTPSIQASAAEGTLILQSWLLAMLATVLPIAAMLLKRRELQRELVKRNEEMHNSLIMFTLAEDTANMGRWYLNLRTGEQDWSPNMLEMNGLSRSLAPDPGDVTNRLPDGGEELFRQIAANRRNTEPYSFTYRIKPINQLERILRIAIRNEFDDEGQRFAVLGVALDVTEQVRREEALELARGRAMQLASEAQKLANTDPLTQLPNRRCTFDRLESMIVMAEDGGTPLSVILFDVDHFKAVNDGYGHQVGDAVLQEMADLARKQVRQGDIVGRIGGEEFVWLVPGAQSKVARQLAERLRECVEEGTSASSLPKVTISVGLAHFRSGDTGQSLMARADAALYAAKDNGRNQVKRAA
ncbi:diguanylate cyclase [Aurantiacibacter rhizosphaerae]|uniref:diguanylate cyclase n=1 Tax=Aurantiacibacter rhizosphaerae TaxID=2691582 RepID=A0A844XG16_9SPHN|nr:diguanylate cyclase [Aurantiacibacter rhizosphaerae]